jgi:UrcA family protein
MPRKILPLVFALAFTAAPASAASVVVYGFAPTLGSQTVERQTVVNYQSPGDVTGATALLARITAAADQVCSPYRPSAFLDSKVAQCRKGAVRRAVHDVGSPALSAVATD